MGRWVVRASTNSQVVGQLGWESYPERLQRAGIDWYVYQEVDNFTDNMLPFFKGFVDTTTDLYRRGNSFIPTPDGQLYGPALAAKLRADVVSGNLPQVSWIVGSYLNSEHPEAAPSYGANFTAASHRRTDGRPSRVGQDRSRS